MNYSARDISEIVKRRKESFFIRLILSALLIIGAVTVIALFPETTVIFFAVTVIILCIAFIIRTLLRYHPAVLFSKEITGVNVKEHEFAITNLRPTFSARVVMPRRKTSSFTGGTKRTKPTTGAIVYLRISDDDIAYIDGLTNAQTDIYEIGDTLYKYPGTKYPIIIGRKASSQPCPLCGTANRDSEPRCITCGLEITK